MCTPTSLTPTLNDFRPVALTPVAMKCLEKVVLTHINHMIPDTVDPLQFAYRPNRSVDDAVAIALHYTLQHLESSKTYGSMLFLDYSSAFNTIRPGRLIMKLADLGVPTPTCNWILDFLTERPQVVKMGGRVLLSSQTAQEHHRAAASAPNSSPCSRTTVSPPRTATSSSSNMPMIPPSKGEMS